MCNVFDASAHRDPSIPDECFKPIYISDLVADPPVSFRPERMQHQMDADALELAQLGYKQEFKRAFSALHVFGFVFSLFGLFSSMSYVFSIFDI